MNNAWQPAAQPEKTASIHSLENDTLLYIYKEASEVRTSEDFLQLLELELKRRNLIVRD